MEIVTLMVAGGAGSWLAGGSGLPLDVEPELVEPELVVSELDDPEACEPEEVLPVPESSLEADSDSSD